MSLFELGRRYRVTARGLMVVALELYIILGFRINSFDYDRLIPPKDGETVDFIVVGSGSAGSVVAGRLSEISKWDVLVFEAGITPSPMSYIPGLYYTQFLTEMDWKYKIVSQRNVSQAFKDGVLPYPRGKTIGGTSAINGLMYIRGNRRDFNRWAELGNPGWDFDSVLKYFKKSENYEGPKFEFTSHFRGFDGPMPIRRNKKLNNFQNVAYEAANELGYNVTDHNGVDQIGIAIPDLHLKDGVRESSADSFLRLHLQKRKNLNLLARAYVKKIILNKDKKAIGVAYDYHGETRYAYAKKEVIICGGSIESPKLLLLSGIGPKEDLKYHNIPVEIDLPGVGKNLQDHVGVFGGLTWIKGSLMGSDSIDLINPFSYLEYSFSRTGVLARTFGLEANLLASIEGEYSDLANINLQILSTSMLTDQGFSVYNVTGYDENFFLQYFGDILGKPSYNINPYIFKVKSVGKLTLKSKYPHDFPIIDSNILSHPDDVELLTKALKFAIKYGNTYAFRSRGSRFHNKPLPGCTHFLQDSDEYFRCYVKKMGYAFYHMTSTCKMAPASDPMGVVDARLRVRGTQGLRVIDASIMPNIIAGNTHAPIVMIGEKGADMIKEDWGVLL